MRCRDTGVTDAGAGAILALALVMATVLLAGLLVPVVEIAVGRHRAASAADAAALAAADALVGIATGDPCLRAAEVAAADGVVLRRCVPDGLVVTVRVSAATPLLDVEATATAGPPEDR